MSKTPKPVPGVPDWSVIPANAKKFERDLEIGGARDKRIKDARENYVTQDEMKRAGKAMPHNFNPMQKGRRKGVKRCIVCMTLPAIPETEMCGPCTFGESETVDGNW